MKRIPEPELMEKDDQAKAYAEADFCEPHESFVRLFIEFFGAAALPGGYVLDLGCGCADVTVRFSRAFPDCTIHGVDGSAAMLSYGRARVANAFADESAKESGRKNRVELFHGVLPHAVLPRKKYDAVICNSLLHHLPDPQILWQSTMHYTLSDTPVFVMDLTRPASPQDALHLVEKYAKNEPQILQHDFYHSLLAAYTPSEIAEQLKEAQLDHLSIRTTSDRHVLIAGLR